MYIQKNFNNISGKFSNLSISAIWDTNYFLKKKYTAPSKQKKPHRWFKRSCSFLKRTKLNTTKTDRVSTSCIIFNCKREKGPPYSVDPNLFAGTWTIYSNKAMAQLNSITPQSGRFLSCSTPLNFKCPYQARVINTFDIISKPMVIAAFILLLSYLLANV